VSGPDELTRPADLAAELGIAGVTLRNWLRATYPRTRAEHGASWWLTPDQVAAARSYFGSPRPARPTSVNPSARPTPSAVESIPLGGHADWFWEGQVQAALVRHLAAEGWTIETVADTASKARGDDVRASRGGRTLRVEVKGYPTVGYADPRRAGETKRARPSNQAGHWFGQALLRVMRDLGRHPDDLVAIALPDWPRFHALIADTEPALRRLGVGVLIVMQGGTVKTRLPIGAS